MTQRTVVILKPDAFARQMLGELTTIFERKGMTLVGCKLSVLSQDILNQHYAHLRDRPFFSEIVAYMQSAPVLIQCWEGIDSIDTVRALVGDTNGRVADPGTIRGRFSMSIRCNLLHASDSIESAAEEIDRFFTPSELFNVTHPLRNFLFGLTEH